MGIKLLFQRETSFLSEGINRFLNAHFQASFTASVVKMLNEHPLPTGFEFDSEPPKSPDTADLRLSRIKIISQVSVRESQDNSNKSRPGHSLTSSGLALPVKSRSKQKMGMTQNSSTLKLTVCVRCLIIYFSKTDCLFRTWIKST